MRQTDRQTEAERHREEEEGERGISRRRKREIDTRKRNS